jgi:hypothetical protein
LNLIGAVSRPSGLSSADHSEAWLVRDCPCGVGGELHDIELCWVDGCGWYARKDGVPWGSSYLGQAYCSENGIMHWHGWARAVRYTTAAKAFVAVFAGGSQ